MKVEDASTSSYLLMHLGSYYKNTAFTKACFNTLRVKVSIFNIGTCIAQGDFNNKVYRTVIIQPVLNVFYQFLI